MNDFGVRALATAIYAAALECSTHQVAVEYIPHVRWIEVRISEGVPGDSEALSDMQVERVRMDEPGAEDHLTRVFDRIRRLST